MDEINEYRKILESIEQVRKDLRVKIIFFGGPTRTRT